MKITIHYDDQTKTTVDALKEETVLQALHRNAIPLAANCGGMGRCGVCKIMVMEEDEFTLACKYQLKHDINIKLNKSAANQSDSIVLSGAAKDVVLPKKESSKKVDLGLAIDIGTTTIGFTLISMESGDVIKEYGCMNSQRIHGADVSSRITFSQSKDGLVLLKNMVCQDIIKGIRELTNHPESISHIAIAANTTMLHLLQGLSPKSIGEYPFIPLDVKGGDYSFQEIFQEDICANATVSILPCASAYIGADLTVGARFLGMGLKNDIDLLVDLGTNGEMILGNKDRLLSTSTAAGPAFEASFKTQGIKGSRMIDLIAQARRRGLIDKKGLITRRYFETGIPCDDKSVIDQNTIRDIQLAKGAICAGIKILLERYGITPMDVRNVYVAGGFGFHLQIDNAIYIGLLPKNLKGKYKIAGNTSLLGAAAYLQHADFRIETQKIADTIENIDLANETNFHEVFLKEMDF